MMKITEQQGRAHVLTLKDGKTLRIFARETKEVADSNISDEILIAKDMGLISMTPIVTEEVPKNKKSGGTK